MDTTLVLLSFALSQASFSNYSGVQNNLAWQARTEGLVVHSSALETKFRSTYGGLWSGTERGLYDETRVETQAVVSPMFLELTAQTSLSQDFIPTYLMSNVGLYDEPTHWFSAWFGLAVKETYVGRWLHEIGTDSGVEITANLNGIRLNTELEIFQGLSRGDERWKNVDVRWDFSLIGSISKAFNASVEAGLLYDRDLSLKRRLRQLVMVGATYKIGG